MRTPLQRSEVGEEDWIGQKYERVRDWLGSGGRLDRMQRSQCPMSPSPSALLWERCQQTTLWETMCFLHNRRLAISSCASVARSASSSTHGASISGAATFCNVGVSGKRTENAETPLENEHESQATHAPPRRFATFVFLVS